MEDGNAAVAHPEAEQLAAAVLPGEGRDDLGSAMPTHLVYDVGEEADDRVLGDLARN